MSVRRGKIARLPFDSREEINRRLRDNEEGTRIVAWINDRHGLRGKAVVTSANLSAWREGGYADWLEKEDQIERTQRLTEYCMRQQRAGGGSMDLPAAIVGGQLMEVLEAFDASKLKETLAAEPDTYIGLLLALAKLQKSKADETIARQNEIKLKQNERKLQLEEQRFQRQTCELFLKWHYDKRAAEIAADARLKPEAKISELRELMFGPVKAE